MPKYVQYIVEVKSQIISEFKLTWCLHISVLILSGTTCASIPKSVPSSAAYAPMPARPRTTWFCMLGPTMAWHHISVPTVISEVGQTCTHFLCSVLNWSDMCILCLAGGGGLIVQMPLVLQWSVFVLKSMKFQRFPNIYKKFRPLWRILVNFYQNKYLDYFDKLVLTFTQNPVLCSGLATGGCRVPPESKKVAKNHEKDGKFRKKNRKSRKRRKSGIKGKNQEGSFTLPLLTDRAVYTTGPVVRKWGPRFCTTWCKNESTFQVSAARPYLPNLYLEYR